MRVNTGLPGMIGLKSLSDLAPPLITSGLLRDFHAQQPANSPQPRSWDPNIVRADQPHQPELLLTLVPFLPSTLHLPPFLDY